MKHDGGWSLGSLKDYFDAVGAERQRAVDAALTAQDKASSLSLRAQENAAAQALLAHEKSHAAAHLAAERAFDAALESAKEAVEKARLSTDKRLDGMNEFRSQLSDQAATFLQRNEYNAAHKALADKQSEADERMIDRVGQLEGYVQRTGANSSAIEAQDRRVTSLELSSAERARYVPIVDENLKRLNKIDSDIASMSGLETTVGIHNQIIADLQSFKNRAVGIVAVLLFASGGLGALLDHVWRK